MSAGKPIVLPRHNCNLEILAEHDAYYFHPDDGDSMSDAIESIDLKRFRETIHPRLIATVERRFTWQATYLAALEKIESLQ